MPNAYILPDQRLVECAPGDTVLAAALRAGVPFAHACGGHSSCSTCRVVVVEGRNACAERTPKERVIAERLGFPPEFRLACQTKLTADVTMRRLVLDDDDTELADIRPGFRRRGRGPVRWAFGSGRRARPRPIGDEVHAAVAVRRHPRLHVVLRGAAAVRRDPRPATPHPPGDPRRRASRRRHHQLHGRRRDGPVRPEPQPGTGQPAGGSGRAGHAVGDRRSTAGARGALRPVVRAQRRAARRPGDRRDAVGDARHGDGDRRHRQRRQPRRAGQQGVRHALPDVRRDARRARRHRRRPVARSAATSPARPTSSPSSRCSRPGDATRRGGPGSRRAAAW